MSSKRARSARDLASEDDRSYSVGEFSPSQRRQAITRLLKDAGADREIAAFDALVHKDPNFLKNLQTPNAESFTRKVQMRMSQLRISLDQGPLRTAHQEQADRR